MFFVSYLIEHNRFMNILGIFVILVIACFFSKRRAAIDFSLMCKALALQGVMALIFLKTSFGQSMIAGAAQCITKVYVFADAGIGFVFGNLADATQHWGFIFAFKVLPIIIFFGALTALLFYWNMIQRVVGLINYGIHPLLGTSGAETLCAVANCFLGQTEAPLLVRNYLNAMTRSELLVVMVSGMATISGSILVVYAAMGVPAPHMLAASVMSIPSALMIAKILLPETEKSSTERGAQVMLHSKAHNSFDALAQGTGDGLNLAVNVAAMLIVFLSLLAMIDALIGFGIAYINCGMHALGASFSVPLVTLRQLLGYLCAPFGYLLGFPSHEVIKAGQLLGTKVAVNELIAFKDMITMDLSPRTVDIMTYALCGFSNFSCIGIQVGGIGALIPEKRSWLTELGLYAVLGGALSNLLSACIAALII